MHNVLLVVVCEKTSLSAALVAIESKTRLPQLTFDLAVAAREALWADTLGLLARTIIETRRVTDSL